jgi:hypothetical protein
MSVHNSSEFLWREVPFSENPIDIFNNVYEYWNKMRGDRFAPAWTDLDLLDLGPKLIPHICVVNIPEDNPPFPYRFFGTFLTELLNYEMSGKTTAMLKPEKFRTFCEDQYCFIIESRYPTIFAGSITTENGVVREHFTLRLPLSDDGQRVTNIIAIEKYDVESPELREYYRSFGE